MNEDLDKKAEKKNKGKEYFDALLYAAIVALIIKLFFVEAYKIPTGSMENTLIVGDFLLVNKFVYGATTPRNIPFTNIRIPFIRFPGYQKPEKGDVVVFDFPGFRDEPESKDIVNYVKRLIGKPGDIVKIENGVLYVNNEKFIEPSELRSSPRPQKTNITDRRIFPKGSGWNEDNYGPIKVPVKGDVIKLTPEVYDGWKVFMERDGADIFMTQDNRFLIDDVVSNEYTVRNNYYFMMGDNRSNSLDSRFWGFVSEDKLVGEAIMIYWSWDPGIPITDIFNLVKTIRWDRITKTIN